MLLKKNAETLENMAMKQIRLIEDAFVIDLAVQLVLALQARIAQKCDITTTNKYYYNNECINACPEGIIWIY